MDESFTEEYEHILQNAPPIDIFSKLIEDRIIFLHQDIDTNVASNLIATIIYLDNLDPEEEITIYINSIGGDLYSLFAIYDVFQGVSAPIKTIAIGRAFSAAAVLLAAGEKGSRLIYPNTQIMIHNVQISEMNGSVKEVKEMIQKLETENSILIEMLARHTGQTFNKVNKDCMKDMYLSAEEAVEYGIADSIFSLKKKEPPLKKRRARKKKK